MHESSRNNMQFVKECYLSQLGTKLNILDVGGRGTRKKDCSYRPIFEGMYKTYYVADIQKGHNVTSLMPGPYTLPFNDEEIDLVVSGQMLEHCANPFKSVAEMKRVLKIGGYIVLIAPSSGPRHDTQDGWRFLDDAFRFIVEDIGGLETIADWIDNAQIEPKSSRDWKDHIFIGKRIA